MKINTHRIQFLNTWVDNLTAAEAKDVVDQYIQSGGNHYVVTPNTDIIVKMQDDPELKRICEKADLILTDGQIVVKLSKWLRNPIKERVCMTDFVWNVCDLADERGYKIFLFGGKEDVLARATVNIQKRYPRLNIVDSYSPPFGFEQDKGELEKANERIRKSGADILIVFLGCPKQEKFIAANKDKYKVPISFTMGGCVDFIAGSVQRAPLWMQNVGLEWFYRFLQEPRRMFRRYFIDDMKIFGMAVRGKRRNKAR
ncbi:MAG TPA: glycosyltransferase [Lachnospiraceae bacterium]|nr:glycosyltransferase [Lachnospiraceae bacterium]